MYLIFDTETTGLNIGDLIGLFYQQGESLVFSQAIEYEGNNRSEEEGIMLTKKLLEKAGRTI